MLLFATAGFSFLNGDLAWVATYGRALSAQEIAAAAALNMAPLDPSWAKASALVDFYAFDRADGGQVPNLWQPSNFAKLAPAAAVPPPPR
jgi:hypothetical protein